MDLENARKSAEELRKKLNYHAKKYYEEDNPEITDYEYDMMLRSWKESSLPIRSL